MPTITIDGNQYDFQQGKSIIEVCLENNIDVPHFCWHPALSVSGNCRMCFVDVEGMPKLQISCATQAADGQIVHTTNERAVKGREAIMEFLLINHPLDCPICDEAGQCKLQDYAFLHGRGESRFDEMKNRKEKRVPLGPEVLFDGERCISCSRCIRFAEEVAEQPALTFVQRGDHVTIETFPGTEFNSPYSMNVIDICPVGALTSSDFRFKARVWDMSFNESICPGCARGCNTHVGARDNEILRLDPRTNMKVNEYWMCDPGRLETYPLVNENRFHGPVIKRGDGQIGVSWEEAYSEAVALLRGMKPSEVAFIGSARATCEDNYAFAKFGREVVGSHHVGYLRHIDPEFADNKLRVADRSPNSRGAEAAGVEHFEDLERIIEGIEHGKIKGVCVLDQDIPMNDRLEEAFERLQALIVHASNTTPLTELADVIFATSTWAESEGTWVNLTETVQHFDAVIATKENEHRMGMKLSRLDKFGADNDRWTQGEKRDCKPAWQALQALARLMGTTWKYKWTEDLFDELSQKNPQFAEMNYEKLDTYRGIRLGKGANPEPHGKVYRPHEYRPQIMNRVEEFKMQN
ncbi:MAG: (2Fe-2S)-binding protein [Ignavibacteriae bacterium]|nr:(2Fe-2S)-binding protein [Ignavibacteriota bacterium]MCB9215599.1 (2Fe-2S)-binding protein [Ignavibacteria bacterium]